MLLVLAAEGDAPATRLIERWRPHGVARVGIGDLVSPGWRLPVWPPTPSTAVADGRCIGDADITGVVNRLPHVPPGTLAELRPDDREYAAEELCAFVAAWLDALPCPVLNPPGARSLAGPGWSREQWRVAVTAAGLRPAASPRSGGRRVTVIAGRVLGAASPEVRAGLRRLSRLAGAPVLSAWLSPRERVLRCAPWTDVDDPAIADALLAALLEAA